MPVAIEIVVARLNRLLRGWANYFRIGHASKWFNKVRYYVEKKVRRYIRRVRNKTGYGWKGISEEYLYRDLGVYMTTEFHGEGLEGEGLSESRVRENFMHGSMKGNRKNR